MPDIKSKCVERKRLALQPIYPRMADSPEERIKCNLYPFKKTAVDYIGPLEVTVARGSFKHWCFWFTCLVTKVAHLEMVKGLDTSVHDGNHYVHG